MGPGHFTFPTNCPTLSGVMLLANLQWKVAFDTSYTNKFLIRIHSRTHYQSLEHTKVLYEIVSK